VKDVPAADDRNGDAGVAKLPAEIEAIDARQEDVENDEVVVVDAYLLEGVVAVAGDVHRIRKFAER
jgi:hypothetical protein